MADREQPYDPYIPSGGAQGGAGTQAGGNQRTAALQAVSQTPASQLSLALFQHLRSRPINTAGNTVMKYNRVRAGSLQEYANICRFTGSLTNGRSDAD